MGATNLVAIADHAPLVRRAVLTVSAQRGPVVGAPSENGKTVGGSAPNFLTTQGDALFVSNGSNDMIERIDTGPNRIVAKQRIVPSPLLAKVRGVSPSGMIVSPDGKRLYVAELGINAIAVLAFPKPER